MSKKTSNPKTSSLDESLIEEPAKVESVKTIPGQEVSLFEYQKTAPFSFNSKNYKLLLIGLAINILGYLLMIGGATEDPAKFDGDALFSTVRITIAPMLIVAGFVVIMVAIMKKHKA